MAGKSSRLGSSFESWLDEHAIREDVTATAIKSVIALQLAEEMKARRLTKSAMAERMQTSRAQLDRLLDPDNAGVTLETLQRAARVLGRQIKLELV